MFIIKRPLCLAALGLALVLLCLPADLWIKDPPAERERPPVLTGIICHMEPDGMTVWLTDTNYPDTGIILVSFEAETSFSIGNTILLENNYKIREPETPSNPGQFDARLYYQTKGIGLLCYAREAELVRDDVRPLSQLLYELQKAFSDRIRRLFPENKSGVLEAMLLGNKTDLEAETRSLYQKSGMSHLLAISGVKTLKLDIPLVPETRINWAFVPLHIAIIYILKLCLDEEIIPRCRFPCSRGYFTKCINWQKKQ